MYSFDDTIAAVATAGGAAGLAVVRVSGGEAIPIADRVFGGGRRLAEAGTHTLHHGWASWPAAAAGDAAAAAAGGLIDEVVAGVFLAPRSYTREDTVEFSCHGGRIPASRVLAALLASGARLAGPGEFTLRAFVSGRIDLAQAEAVADLIRAETGAAHALALSQLAGGLSRRLRDISARITDALAEVEARVDFAEDVGGIEVPARVIEATGDAAGELSRLLSGSKFARAIREGVRVPIVGRPNVGKSSLFNALVGEDRAIVTATPGTTRDRVSEAVEIAGVRVALSDTAGLCDTAEPVEAIGVIRAEEALAESRIVLWVVDASVPLDAADVRIAPRLADKDVLIVLNKRDRGVVIGPVEAGAHIGEGRWQAVEVSATTGEGLDELRAGLAAMLEQGSGTVGPAAGNPRHVDALERARASFDRATAAGREGRPGEIVALELREGLDALGEVTGESVGEDLLERIFSRFCIGK